MTDNDGALRVKEVLTSMGEGREWVHSLGVAIYLILRVDPAVAASRATDLANNPETGQAVESVLVGFIGLRALAAKKTLTLWQRGTIIQLLIGMTRALEQDIKDLPPGTVPQ